MYPPIFAVCAADSDVVANFGSAPTRLYPFGDAPQNVTLPYATWQTIGGSPENYLDCPPDIDVFSLQIDVYAETEEEARDGAQALRDVIEQNAYIVGWRGESRDTTTMNYRYSFDVDWHVNR